MRKFSREEYETILSFDFPAGKWRAWTNIPSAISKFKKQGWKLTEELKYEDGSIESCKFEAPKGAITIGKADRNKSGYQLTEEHKKKMRDARAARNTTDA